MRQTGVRLLVTLVTVWAMASDAGAQVRVVHKPWSKPDSSEKQSPRLKKVRSTTSSGPLRVGGRTFSVAFRHEKLVDARYPDFAETVASLAIRDAAGKTHFRESMSPVIRARAYMPVVLVSVEVVENAAGEAMGLVLSYGYRPGGLGFAECRFLAVKDGVLTPLPGPLHHKTGLGNRCGLRDEGGTGHWRLWPNEPSASAEAAASSVDGLLKLRVHNDYYAAVVPVVVDLAGWALRPLHATGTFEIERIQRYIEEDANSVDLFPDRALRGRPARVEVTAKTRVEFLDVYATLRWDERTDGVHVALEDTAALRVKLDGREGWVSGWKDLHALGLPERMPPPR